MISILLNANPKAFGEDIYKTENEAWRLSFSVQKYPNFNVSTRETSMVLNTSLAICWFVKVVGDLGIEPSVRLREGVTVPCHTLRPVAHFHHFE
jgi:hypothetical protein